MRALKSKARVVKAGRVGPSSTVALMLSGISGKIANIDQDIKKSSSEFMGQNRPVDISTAER